MPSGHDVQGRQRSYGQIITYMEEILKEKFSPDYDDGRMLIVTRAIMIEHGNMYIRRRV